MLHCSWIQSVCITRYIISLLWYTDNLFFSSETGPCYAVQADLDFTASGVLGLWVCHTMPCHAIILIALPYCVLSWKLGGKDQHWSLISILAVSEWAVVEFSASPYWRLWKEQSRRLGTLRTERSPQRMQLPLRREVGAQPSPGPPGWGGCGSEQIFLLFLSAPPLRAGNCGWSKIHFHTLEKLCKLGITVPDQDDSPLVVSRP